MNKNTQINISSDYNLINPDINKLFKIYDYLFFDNKLNSVQLKWNDKEKRNAGYCKFNSMTSECIIELSSSLLQYRTTKEIIQTLIHEMIHSYIYINKKINHDRTKHGSRFSSIMNVINHICKDCKLHVTVRHNFFEEIKINKSCKWQYNGICKRVIYRPWYKQPGKHEIWWNRHQNECGGTYQQIESNNIKINYRKIDKKRMKNRNKVDIYRK